MTGRRFGWWLAGIALVGFAVRLAYGLAANVPSGFGDDVWYHAVANGLVHGRGFSDPFNSIGPDGQTTFGAFGKPISTAFHLPLFPALLALGSVVGLDTYTAHQAMGWALGAGTVVVAGLIGRRLGGARLGLMTAAIAAVYLPLAINDSLLMSESLYGLLIALVLLALLRQRERPDVRRTLALGALIGLAALTRTEALALVVLLAPIVARPRLRNVALVCAAVAVLVLPWCVRNSLVFHRPVGLTTGAGSVLAGANQHTAYYGPLIGAWDFKALYRTPAGRHVVRNEAVQSARWRHDAQRYIGHHAGRLPLVVAARVARTWSVYPFSPAQKARFASDHYKHLRRAEYLAFAAFVLVVALALAGAGRVRRVAPIWLLLAPMVLVSLVSATGYGDTRFRQAADVALVVLAGAGVERFVSWWLSARHRPAKAAAGADLGDQLAQEPALGNPGE